MNLKYNRYNRCPGFQDATGRVAKSRADLGGSFVRPGFRLTLRIE
jgi:hypothetical protein